MGVTNSNPNSYEEMLKRLQQDRNTPPPVVPAPALSPAAVAEMERLHKQDADDPIYSDGVTPTETLKPVDNNAWYDAWVSQLEPPMDAEEKARRERAAYISSGIMNLGNAFGAIGNMFAARHGAPAQKMADIPDVDTKVNAFRARADKVRDAYLNGLATREKMRQQDALLKIRNDQLAESARYNNERLQIQRDREERLRLKDSYNQKRLEALSQKDAAQAEYWKAKAEAVDSLTQSQVQANLARAGASDAQAEAAYARAAKTRSETGGEKVVVKTKVDPLTGREIKEETRTSHTKAGGGENGKGKVNQNKLAGFSIRK